MVIPQPQVMQRVSAQRVMLGEAGTNLAQTVAAKGGTLFAEAVDLIARTLRERGLVAESRQPVTTIRLTTKANLTPGTKFEPPALSEQEFATLALPQAWFLDRAQRKSSKCL